MVPPCTSVQFATRGVAKSGPVTGATTPHNGLGQSSSICNCISVHSYSIAICCLSRMKAKLEYENKDDGCFWMSYDVRFAFPILAGSMNSHPILAVCLTRIRISASTSTSCTCAASSTPSCGRRAGQFSADGPAPAQVCDLLSHAFCRLSSCISSRVSCVRVSRDAPRWLHEQRGRQRQPSVLDCSAGQRRNRAGFVA